MYFSFSVLDARTSTTTPENKSDRMEVHADLSNDETTAAYRLLKNALEISNITESAASNNENLFNTTTTTSPIGSISSTSSNESLNSILSTVITAGAGRNLSYKCKY